MDSHLQIISGKYRGRKLSMPPSARPTQNRARIALFNMLDEIRKSGVGSRESCLSNASHLGTSRFPESESSRLLIPDSRFTVWDAFAGSGAFGIEFLSRNWAKCVIFTDTDADAVKAIRKNLTGIDFDAVVYQKDALVAAKEFGKASDVVFIDPPYDKPELGERLVSMLAEMAKPGTIIILEKEKGKREEEKGNENFTILKDKIYGRSHFFIMRKN